MVPFQNPGSNITINNKTISFGAGFYTFSASFNYPQLTQLPPSRVLNTASQNLINQQPDQTTSLSFLSYTEKLLAGAWRFLTYFGRDSMISALLLEPVISQGNGSATEAVIGAVLERLNRSDGSVCHEETIGRLCHLPQSGKQYHQHCTRFYLSNDRYRLLLTCADGSILQQ